MAVASAVTLERLIAALEVSWSAETDYSPNLFNPLNPARGQCVVTSLVVQHFLGGELLRYHVSGCGYDENHFANILPSGTLVDVSYRQYQGATVNMIVSPKSAKAFASVRERLLDDADNRNRYELLLAAVSAKLVQFQE